MARFESLQHAPLETRRILRERFRRNLHTSRSTTVGPREPIDTSDESILRLLLDLRIVFESDVERAKATYEEARREHPTAPEFDALLTSGWFRVVWGRVHTGLETGSALRTAPDALRVALSHMLARRHQRRFEIDGPARDDPALLPIVEQIEKAPNEIRTLTCPTPEWVAARVWERAPDSLTGAARLRFWVDRCDLLGDPAFTPSAVWDRKTADEFHAAAIEVLRTDHALVGWDALRRQVIARLSLGAQGAATDVERFVPPIPVAFVDRYLWLNAGGLERARDAYETCGDLWGLVDVLLREPQDTDRSLAPHPIAQQVLDLVADRPELLAFMTLVVRRDPALLADLVLDPRFAALACLLVADWPSAGGAWDRALTEGDNETARSTAFADAIAVLGHCLSAGSAPPTEAAALFSWMHAKATASPFSNRRPPVSERMLADFRSELARQPDSVLRAMVESCLSFAPDAGVGHPTFAAALDVVAVSSISETLDPVPFLTAYTRSISSGGRGGGRESIDPLAARALLRLAMRASPQLRRAFLASVDVPAMLARAEEPDANPFTIADEVAGALRVHIRVLSRAISVWDGAPPEDVLSALNDAVRRGALEHKEKARVAAFSARYETNAFGTVIDRPIAADLGVALFALPDEDREKLLNAILETDEPLLLARLLPLAPHATRARINTRLGELTPKDAGRVLSLPEAEARIEALLSIGAADAAAKFIDNERELKTLGRVPGRELTQLRTDLRLRLLQRDFAGIENASVPEAIAQGMRVEAEDIVTFYKGVAELTKPDGSAEKAEVAFDQLHRRRPDVAAYAANLLAARTGVLLPGDPFQRLGGYSLVRAREVLSEADAMMEQWVGAGGEDSAVLAGNKALLFLATGQPEQAYDVLESLDPSSLDAHAAACRTVALSRLGRDDNATQALSAALERYGDADILRSARAHIKGGRRVDARVATVTADDAVRRIKIALFELANMSAPRQVAVVGEPPGEFEGFLIQQVRATAAVLVGLVPMMKGVDIDSCEDDLNALFGELLEARFGMLRWSLRDQSQGGFTARGNPGRRDLIVRKDGSILTVLEAVVIDRAATTQWTKGELVGHFQKLLGYSSCRLFFHLTYSYVADAAGVLQELRRIAETQPPSGFAFVRREEIPLSDSAPTGFVATFNAALGDIRVVFLVLDMAQRTQRGAANAAAASNPRRKKTSTAPTG